MKRFCLCTIMLIFLCFFASCEKEPEEPAAQWVEIAGQQGTVTFDSPARSSGTLELESGLYLFSYDVRGTQVTVTITYPDGYVYTHTEINGGYGMPLDYDSEERQSKGYPDGLSLAWGIEGAMKRDEGSGSGSASPLLAILLLGLGVWYLAAPRSAWWLGWGWRYRDAEPSELALGMYRFGGGVLIFAGILCAIGAL